MNHLFYATFVFIFCSSSAFGCSVDFPTLREEFREARHVFVGRVADIQDPPKNLAQAKEKQIFGVVKFDVERSWKGAKTKEISLLSAVGGSVCPGDFDSFKKGEKYLVFADKGYVHYHSAKKIGHSQREMKRLDSFWFRVFSRIYPF